MSENNNPEKTKIEMTLKEWCGKLPHFHKVNKDLVELIDSAYYTIDHNKTCPFSGKERLRKALRNINF